MIAVEALPAHTLLILAGGRSSRMGRDKAGMPFPGRLDPPMVSSVQRRLGGGALECLLAGRSTYGLGCRLVPDLPGHPGPLGGLLAGLQASATDLVLVAAADMPAADPALASGLLLRASASPLADAVVPVSEYGSQPLFAVYRRRAGARLRQAPSGSGGRGPSLREAIGALVVEWVPEREWRGWDPQGASFADCDTPEQMARAARLVTAAWEG